MLSRENTLLKWRQPTAGLLREVRELYRNHTPGEILSLIAKGLGIFLLAGLVFVIVGYFAVGLESLPAGERIKIPSFETAVGMVAGFGLLFFLFVLTYFQVFSWYGSLVRFRETFFLCNGTQYSYEEIKEYELDSSASTEDSGAKWELRMKTVDGKTEVIGVPPSLSLNRLQSVLGSCLEDSSSDKGEVEVYHTHRLVAGVLSVPALLITFWPLVASYQQQSLTLPDILVGLTGLGVAAIAYVYFIRPRWILEKNQIRITDRLFREDRLIPYSEVTKLSWNRDMDMHERGKLFPYRLRNLEKSSTLARKIVRRAARNGEVEIEGNDELEESLSGKD